MSKYNIVVATSEATVVAEYTAEASRAAEYQNEKELEKDFIKRLCDQGYEYLEIRREEDLVKNLRVQLEKLNDYKFSEDEWQRFFAQNIANINEGIQEKTKKIQEDHVQILKKDDGMTKNIMLIDKKNVFNNSLQVINQYEEDRGRSENRYDVTILFNGIPLIHVELKRRGVALREAFNQINRYQRESFWAGSGLYEYIHIFVVSNGTHTKYYSNTTREQHLLEAESKSRVRTKKTSHSFEFTSFWADETNKTILDLVDFTKTFFAKHTILNIITKYCVFTSEKLLLVMRPYQIAATEKIISRIVISSNNRQTGTIKAGGYVWHTTGSGKTLTSFKTAQLATLISNIDNEIQKVLFVVDRKDLDYQTMQEYDKFQKGAANGNTSTKILKQQLEDPNVNIIITTIQKLDVFIGQNKVHPIYKQHVVLIFDECHRSQFGEMHKRIVKSFSNYHLFGFTGTPIFNINASSQGNLLLKTTEQAFGDKLHSYTIVHAINDGNVLPFRIDFINTIKERDDIKDALVSGIEKENTLMSPLRIREVAKYILEHFNQKTMRSSYYTYKGRKIDGFNSILAVQSIAMAMKYYSELKKQIQENNLNLRIAIIYSFSPNESEPDCGIIEEGFDADSLDATSKEFLQDAIKDYNTYFETNFDVSSNKYENYYKDISMRMKNRDLDLLIVVNMFLTGFDATTLNTLWVDKNLRLHGLLQAFSRTNRILNTVKTFGNIICFRDLKAATEESVALFGDKDACGIIILGTFEDYYTKGYTINGTKYPGFESLINKLTSTFSLPVNIIGEIGKKDFLRLYGSILKIKNILSVFDEFEGKEILEERDYQDYQSAYIDIYQDLSGSKTIEKTSIIDDIVFELELVKRIDVNIDYILMLVEKYKDTAKDKEIRASIIKAINASIELRSKKDLIEAFIDQINIMSDVGEDWESYVKGQKEKDITAIIQEEKLKPEETQRFIANAFRDGIFKTAGTDIDSILPPMSRFAGRNRTLKKEKIIERLLEYFNKYQGIGVE